MRVLKNSVFTFYFGIVSAVLVQVLLDWAKAVNGLTSEITAAVVFCLVLVVPFLLAWWYDWKQKDPREPP